MADKQATVEYRDIPEFPGYRVGTDGSVWSCRKIGTGGIGSEWRRVKIKIHNSKCPYRCVSFWRDGKSYLRLVHRLVLQTFVGPCPNGMESAHDDGNPANNGLGNLRWRTPKENAADRQRHGTQARGERMGIAVLTDAQAAEIIRRLNAGEVQRRLAEEYRVNYRTINNLARGKTFRHVGGSRDE